MKPTTKSVPFFKGLWCLNVIFIYTLLLVLLSNGRKSECNSIAPSIDYSHNMRILKLPKWTPTGSLIYRLKGSDGDPNTQLNFGVSGLEARSLLEILPVPHSWNEADVFLKSPLVNQDGLVLAPQYNLSLYVSDGNLSTQVESTILVTDPDLENPPLAGGGDPTSSGGTSLPSAFLNTKHIFNVPENIRPDEPLGQISVLESEANELPVRFEIRGRGADKFSIKYTFGPRGQSRAELILAQPVDYEKQNLFNLKILALNAWTDLKWDTRNVVSMDIVITLTDVQDSPPIFRSAPTAIKLTNVMQVGDLVAHIEAEDGDVGDQRPVHYALDASSSVADYFQIDKLSGQIRLARPMSELSMHASWSSPSWSILTIIANEPPDPVSYDHLWPPMYSKLELPLILIDVVNEEPLFLGGWKSKASHRVTNGHENAKPNGDSNNPSSHQAGSSFALDTLHAFLVEVSPNRDPSGMAVQWYTNGSSGNANLDQPGLLDGGKFERPVVMDLNLGQNGTFQLSLEGQDASLFRIEPALPVSKQTNLMLFIVDNLAASNWSLFDRDQPISRRRESFRLDIVARDFGSPRLASRIHCEIVLLDANDNGPQFDSDLYAFSVYENAQRGQQIGFVRARDADSASASNSLNRVRYGPLNGLNAHLFRVNPETGQVSLEQAALDRERESMYLFIVEAFDLAGNSNYSRVMITVLDINDNSPVFLQSHYDAVLLPDGSFHQPLIVRALDADEPGTANSQVAYEIIAGNRDEQFVIDSVSGTLYPAGHQPSSFNGGEPPGINHHLVPSPGPPPPLQLPPSISAPIEPFGRPPGGHPPPGKILNGGREVEETTWPSGSRTRASKSRPSPMDQQQTTLDSPGNVDQTKLARKRTISNFAQPNVVSGESITSTTTGTAMKTEPMLSLDSQIFSELTPDTRALLNRFEQGHSLGSGLTSKLPPMITLLVRAHDFGIPLRSSTVRVNIYNQAQLSRTLSVILNGTLEQIESRRDAIERSFSSITGSRATIESVESLSDSSSLCVAHVRLTLPQHALVDLTDLTALIDAIDYRPHSYGHYYSHMYPPQHESSQTTVPGQGAQPARATSSGSGFGQGSNITAANQNSFFTDLHTFHSDGSSVEKKLLIYIIIVAVCILSLIVLWMICSQSEHNNLSPPDPKILQNNNQVRIESNSGQSNRTSGEFQRYREKGTSTSQNHESWQSTEPKGSAMMQAGSMGLAGSGLLRVPNGTVEGQQVIGLKPDRLSMYNGQVWFEPLPLVNPMLGPQSTVGNRAVGRDGQVGYFGSRQVGNHLQQGERRLSSTQSLAGSVHSDSQLAIRNARGKFFPNARGYNDNLNSLTGGYDGNSEEHKMSHRKSPRTNQTKMNKRSNRRRIVPIDASSLLQDQADAKLMMRQQDTQQSSELTDDDHRKGGRSGMRRDERAGSLSSGEAQSSSGETLILDSDQELLGFDSTGTPIIATLTKRTDQLIRGSSVTGPEHSSSGAASMGLTNPMKIGQAQKNSTSLVPMEKRTDSNSKNNLPAANYQPPTPAAPVLLSNKKPAASTPRKQMSKDKSMDQRSEVTQKLNSNESRDSQTVSSSSNRQSKQNQLDRPTKEEVREQDRTETEVDNSESVSNRVKNAEGSEREIAQQKNDIISELNEKLKSRKSLEDEAAKEEAKNDVTNLATSVSNSGNMDRPASGKPEGRSRLERIMNQKAMSILSSASDQSTDLDDSRSPSGKTKANHGSTNTKTLEDEMKNGDLLKKESIFALTYKQLASERVP